MRSSRYRDWGLLDSPAAFMLAVLLLGSTSSFGQPAAESAVSWSPLVQRLVEDGYARENLEPLFAQISFDPEPIQTKVNELFENKFHATRIRKIQEGLNQLGFDAGPADGLEGSQTRRAVVKFQRANGLPADGRLTARLLWQIEAKIDPGSAGPDPATKGPAVYQSVFRPERVAEAQRFLEENLQILERTESDYGIAPEISVALLAVETRVGNYLGEKPAFRTLSSLAVASDLEVVRPLMDGHRLTAERELWLSKVLRQRSDWAYSELRALFVYAEQARAQLLQIPGSIYGAIGMSQFMPSNVPRFGVDGNGDGRVDLFEAHDAVPSLANYLKQHGWRRNLKSRKERQRVIFKYNRSNTYANTILTLADTLRPSTSTN